MESTLPTTGCVKPGVLRRAHSGTTFEVEDGERYVCVGWIQSYVQSNEHRNFLFGLDAGAKGLLSKHGRSDELDLIFQAYSNLLRSLGD